MTSLILENADLNRLFPKCRPRGGHPPQSGAGSHHQPTGQQPHDRRNSTSTCKKLEPVTTPPSLSSSSSTSVVTGGSGSGFPHIDMIDLEHDNNTDRQVNVCVEPTCRLWWLSVVMQHTHLL